MNARRAHERRRELERSLEDAARATSELIFSAGGWDAVRRGHAIMVVPQIPDDAPHELKQALARRREAHISGRCVCGARARVETSIAVGKGDVATAVMEHDSDCTASDEVLFEIAVRTGWRLPSA